MSQVRNKELYNYIFQYYITGEKSQRDVAEHFGMSLGAIKNFMYRHKINKKKLYNSKKFRIRELYKKELSIRDIAKLLDISTQYVYYVLENYRG